MHFQATRFTPRAILSRVPPGWRRSDDGWYQLKHLRPKQLDNLARQIDAHKSQRNGSSCRPYAWRRVPSVGAEATRRGRSEVPQSR